MKTTVAIIGGGPGGATSAMSLQKYGIDSVIIEKDEFPRYHIGESMTGECGAIVRRLGLEEKMKMANFPVKRGLTVYGTGGKNSWFVPVMRRSDEDGKLYPQFTWQVRRSEFDKIMLDEAIARGATLLRGQAFDVLRNEQGAVAGLKVRLEDGTVEDVESEVVLDCSGQSTFLANLGVTGPKFRGNYDRQIAIYSQVKGAIRDEGDKKDDTIIFYKGKYHWSWFIPLDDEVVSVGVVISSAYFQEKNESKRDFLIRELKELNPEIVKRIPDINLVEDVRSIVNYSFQVREFTGPGFICIGDAHRFIDPIFSFGLYVSMKESQFAADAIAQYLDGVDRDLPNPFIRHQQFCERGIDVVEDFVDFFWEHPLAFASFMHVRHFDEMIDSLAGRIYEGQPSPAVASMRKLLGRNREEQDQVVVPVGSRYHPERAQLGREEYQRMEE
ncbi:MAG TPA: tryptophan 7-halogenase [Anaerolineales bacterium]|nr:tryptophan 7-halogenase [Anaerolineales bacterium]